MGKAYEYFLKASQNGSGYGSYSCGFILMKGSSDIPGTLKKDFPCSAWRLSRITKRQQGLGSILLFVGNRRGQSQSVGLLPAIHRIQSQRHRYIASYRIDLRIGDWEFRSISTSPVDIMNELPNKTRNRHGIQLLGRNLHE